MAELWHGGLARMLGAPYALDATQGRSPSLLNGHLFDAAPFLVLATLGMIAVELKTLDQVYGLTSTGKTINANGDLVMKSYVPGDLGFDPLGLAPTDPAEFAEMREKELAHCRLGMIAAAGFLAQEAVTGKTWAAEDSIFERLGLGAWLDTAQVDLAGAAGL